MGIPIPIIDSLLGIGKSLIERKWPDPQKQAEELRKLQELHQQGRLAELQAEVTLLTAQTDINKMEAQHGSIFVAGWRPWVGWVGGMAFAYSTILEPLLRFAATLSGYDGEFPELDNDLTLQVLLGMLGLGIMRSFDKKNGVDTRRTG